MNYKHVEKCKRKDKEHLEMKNTLPEMKDTLGGINQLDTAVRKIKNSKGYYRGEGKKKSKSKAGKKNKDLTCKIISSVLPCGSLQSQKKKGRKY